MVTQTQETLPQGTLPQGTLPPTARDFEAYRLVKVERHSTRAVAKLLRLSQTRVCQVISRVAGYLVDTTEPEDETRREQQLAVARQVAAEQIDYCKKRALRSYERSCGIVKVVREVENPAGQVTRTTTTRENFGETRYLSAVARLAVIGSKLPTCTQPIAVRRTADEIAADVDETTQAAESSTVTATGEVAELEVAELDVAELEVAEVEVLAAPPPLSPFALAAMTPASSSPSEEACSVKAFEQARRPPTLAELEFVRREMLELYNSEMRALNRPERQLSETVHPPVKEASADSFACASGFK